MARRVYIANAGLKISQAGYDAATASDLNLLLDTTTERYFGVFTHGTLATSAFTKTADYSDANGEHAEWQYSLSYGRTFTNPPIVRCMVPDTYGSGTQMMPWYYDQLGTNNGTLFFNWQSFVDHALFLFTAFNASNNKNYPALPPNLAYIVGWQH